MLWLTWRQFRPQAIAVGAALAVLAIALAATGPHLAALYGGSGLTGCASTCGKQVGNFISQVKGSEIELIFYGGIFLVYAAPALIGIFWGAPLVTREIESGTFRLAWSQSVTRRRWTLVKLGLVGLASMASAGLLSLMIGWWASPLYRAAAQAPQNSLDINRLTPPLFGATGIAPIGYAALAFAMGVTVGLLIRRTIPAMAVTLAVFAAIQILWPGFVRPYLLPAAHVVRPLGTVSFNGIGDFNNGTLLLQVGSVGGLPPDVWYLDSHAVNAAGRLAKAPPACTLPQARQDNDFFQCLQSHGIRLAVTYQPASRYWAFQWLETATFVFLAAGLGGVCYVRIRRIA
jgi:hypothetical protein